MSDLNIPKEVLDAFEIRDEIILLPGGQGTTYRVGNLVLKPVQDAVEAQWIAELQLCLGRIANPAYRIAEPVAAKSSGSLTYVVGGWCATKFIPGIDGPGDRWKHMLRVVSALHNDLKQVVLCQTRNSLAHSNCQLVQ